VDARDAVDHEPHPVTLRAEQRCLDPFTFRRLEAGLMRILALVFSLMGGDGRVEQPRNFSTMNGRTQFLTTPASKAGWKS
jgi:hypothetical protein